MTEFDLPRERKVGHLTLLRPPRTLTSREFNLLPFADRLAVVRGVSGRTKYQLLLDAHDGERLVRCLPAQEIYLLIKELGLVEVTELLPLVDSEQLTTFLDLDCWRGDLFDGNVALEWLIVLAEAGEERILQALEEIDFELITLIFQRLVTVVRAPEDLEENDRLEASQRDGGYELDYPEAETAKQVAALLDVLYRRDPEMFVRLLTAVRWEQGVMFEEENYGRRNLRLQELGFPDPDEAPRVYAWLDPARFDPAECRRQGLAVIPDSDAPAFLLTPGIRGSLLAEVLAGGIDTETAWELTFLLNRVMTADRVDVGSFDQVQEAIGEVYQTLNLALEHQCGSNVDKASRLFADTYLQPLFRLGFSLLLELQRRARQVKKSPIAPFLDGPFRALVRALDQKRPRFYEGLENFTRAGERPFATSRELRLAEEWLARLEAQQRLFQGQLPFELPAPAELDLTGCTPDLVDDLALSDFLLTALANRLLGRSFLPTPLAAGDIAPLQAMVCQEGKISPELRRETVNWLDSLEPGAGAFGDYCLDLWEEDFCPLAPAQIDPRFISGMIIRLG
ncbi:MAG: hypothetical protein IH614_04110 [Desulfuromonadales bacterium]|nr:hypothetical protein [Desulfuromonadales bacterium]